MRSYPRPEHRLQVPLTGIPCFAVSFLSTAVPLPEQSRQAVDTLPFPLQFLHLTRTTSLSSRRTSYSEGLKPSTPNRIDALTNSFAGKGV